MLILGVDPGKMTGWAMYSIGFGEPPLAGQMPHDDFARWALLKLGASTGLRAGEVHVTCEAFVITGGTLQKSRGDENWSIEQIGLLRYLCLDRGLTFSTRTAASAKKFANNTRLKQLGWHQPGRDHANDALRHVLLHVAETDTAELDRLLTAAGLLT